jgi:hypothetical protein
MFNLIRKCFDSRSELQSIANDRNLMLVGCATSWMVLTADGCILSTGTSSMSALTDAIFGGN